MRIAVVKPDWGVSGGFERLLERIVALLEAGGHRVEEQAFPALIGPRPVFGNSGATKHWFEHAEYFRYVALTEDVRRLDLDRYDLVLSTQPPTFLVDHPRVLALFYHQARIFYDLADHFGRIDEVDPRLHRVASEEVRLIDREFVGSVRHWLAGSNECASRLSQYWDIADDVSLLHAPALTEVPEEPPPWNPTGPVVCVSRHEWPKRTELLVAAGHLSNGRTIEFIGGGGRLDFVRRLDDRITRDPSLARPADPETLWMQSALAQTAKPVDHASSPNRFLGNVSDAVRNRSYAQASVVVAPAYREDYGLTALEAMLWQRPVIVCRDGGGLVDLVSETGAGLVVDPTPAALAAGIERVLGDDDLRHGMLERAREVPHLFTWERAGRQLDDAVERTASA
jgi:glycosyltransferase involved in cell wall biosynthesis